ncbi:hypothetical protein BRARA_E02260 [Brassica rapa]|uniref:Late embryogenesis abundant protein LEA-2 subgroup domain-containing protein n=1 Tax=Brassica campestris TaxID=3711 RepID=A0A397ZIT3_BRACM|nr:hypothetical protein BRARA_E02260 [Brassica rapa]
MALAKHTRVQILGCILLASLALTMADTPPGIAKNPSHATCKIKKYKHCYNLEHVCPKFCPDSCHVECASCKPICGPPSPGSDDDGGEDDGGYTPPAPVPPVSPPPPTPSVPSPTPPVSPPPPTPTPAVPIPTPPVSPPPPTPTPAVPSPTPPVSPPPPSPTPAVPSPTPPSSPPPPTPTPAVPTPTPPIPSVPSPPGTPTAPVPPYSPPETPTPSIPSPTPTPPGSTPPYVPPSSPTPTPPSDGEAGAGVRRARCKKKGSPCYGVEYSCPADCPRSCEVDCVTCKPLCNCDKPGSVCQDPRFIGGDGLTFYFHGKKDSNFCLISDSNLHINAHFIGKRRSGMARDFTWVQSIAILFGTHRFYVGALKTSTWDDSVDRISASFDGHVISLPQLDGATWTSSPGVYPQVSVKRVNADTNNLEVEVEGMLKITARVVPITVEDSRIHGYNVTEDDCLAHLDLGFKFQDLSDNVDGVLGQTYRSNYVSRVKIGVHMPVMGGDREFQTSGLFEPDCSAARFTGNGGSNGGRSKMELPEMSCASGVGGKGVVCKR